MSKENLLSLEFSKEHQFPYTTPEVHNTEKGTQYLTEPGVAVISAPLVDINSLSAFLIGFPEELKFPLYTSDPTPLAPAETLCKTAGQLCYMSFGPERTLNESANIYFKNIMQQGHGSVLEHANVTMLWWGISRSLTHELVRHRAGYGFSQVSQRYVGGKTLRFVERPEYQNDPFMHDRFQTWADSIREEYEFRTNYLMKLQSQGNTILSGERKTDLRKKVRQASRSILSNETEAPILVTANLRAWRHFLSVRGSEHAEVEIRRIATEAYRCLNKIAPLLFADFEVQHLSDGTHGLQTQFPKV